ncbi:8202_t:CDS:2 [Dentiscutata erythropus]|uniref:8202_t:CDS:1 n=1 Tax=Dentiscutata erythropus TaxID=1348616 RepID=A0A9N8VJQ0_9GLOM|nr:8202_t:CDS:2 [Dentiscutata erythropus]
MNSRPLPPGWVSQYDPNYKRYFFVGGLGGAVSFIGYSYNLDLSELYCK